MDSFDPHQQWLGIPSQMRPLNHYILLGVRIFESDTNKIAAAYDTRMSLLKTFQTGPRGELSNELISEVGKAKRDLLNPDRKSKYDIALKKRLQARQREIDQVDDEQAAAAQSRPGDGRAGGESSADEAIQIVPQVSRVRKPAGAAIPASAPSGTPESGPFSHVKNIEGRPLSPSEETSDDQAEDDPEVLSLFSYLKDVRYLVALLTISVVVMTATVKLLSTNQDQVAEPSPADLELASALSDEKTNEAVAPVDPNAALVRVEQAADASFEPRIERGHLTGDGVNYDGAHGLKGWSAGEEAAWMLVVKDRRKGYFNCRITYRSKLESEFEIQLGDRKPRRFTFYPHDEDFEEEFIVRLAKADEKTIEQTLKLRSLQAGANEVEVKRIKLVPNR